MLIHLHGALAKFHKGPLDIKNVHTPKDAAQAVCALLGERVRQLFRTGLFEIYKGNREDDKYITQDRVGFGIKEDEIHFVPVIAGSSNIVRAIVGIVLIVIGCLTSWAGGEFLIVAGVGLLVGGIAGMLTPTPSINGSQLNSGSGQQTTSHLFNGPSNQYGQGMPIPVVYGRFRVGSVLVSQELFAQQIVAAG